MTKEKKLALSLLVMRITVFIVMLMWTLDKFIRPGHAASIFERYYAIAGLGDYLIYAFASAELILLMCFLLGLYKSTSYLVVLILHSVSTLSAIPAYFSPYTGNHLLFFAALPMWAACMTLYLMREEDSLSL